MLSKVVLVLLKVVGFLAVRRQDCTVEVIQLQQVFLITYRVPMWSSLLKLLLNTDEALTRYHWY